MIEDLSKKQIEMLLEAVEEHLAVLFNTAISAESAHEDQKEEISKKLDQFEKLHDLLFDRVRATTRGK